MMNQGKSGSGRPPWRRKRRSSSRGRSGRPGGRSGEGLENGPQKPQQVTGILEVMPDKSGYLRKASNGYLAENGDVFVNSDLIHRNQLRPGVEIQGEAKFAKGKLRLRTIESVMSLSLEEFQQLEPFSRLVCIDPIERLEVDLGNDPNLRIIDLITPIGRGQRSLIVAPPRTGKTIILKKLAQAVVEFHPEIHLMIVLIDERPEEVTDFKRSVDAEVVYSSNDEPASKHVRVVEMVLERSRRMVEAGKDVVLLLDSLTRVARAYNNQTKDRGRTLSGGLGARSMEKPREFFGAARKIEHGGSLTIVATALVDTGSRMDDVIFEEFKGTGNMELILHRGLAEKRVWPAIDIKKSGTRKEEKLRSEETQNKVNLVRRALASQSADEALRILLSKIEKTESNSQFLSLLKG